MNIKEAKEEIKRTILAYTSKTEFGVYRIPTVRQRPILLMGPPGIGKTAIMEQAARECNIGLVAYTMTHHTRQSAIGLPQIQEKRFGGQDYAVTGYTMSEILASVYEQIERTGKREGILFLDEINCVSETLMPALLQFLQYKTFGNHKLPEGWIVAAAGNPVRYNQSVRELDTATLDRVKWMEIEPDLGIWRSYARNQGIHPAILSFLDWRPESFYAVEAKRNGRSFVTARGWEDLSRMLLTLEELGFTVTEDLPGQYLRHEEISREFWIYYHLYEQCRETPYEKLAVLPYDERLCMLQLMLRRVYRLADQWYQTSELLKSLDYFFEGCARQADTKKEDWQKLCQSQLEQRKKGILVKKEYGLLSEWEEEKEAKLWQEVMRQLEFWKLDFRDSGERTDAFPECTVLQERQLSQKETAEELKEFLRQYIDFMKSTFEGKQELYLFYVGLLEHENTRCFLKEQLPELLQKLEAGTNLNQREEALRAALLKQEI